MSGKIAVLLLQNVAGQGNKGDIIEVSAPYARNVLIAKGLGKIADSQTLNLHKQKLEKKQRDHDKTLDSVEAFLESVKDEGITIKSKVSPSGNLYAKIDSKDISQFVLETFKIRIDKQHFVMDKVEHIGEYEIKFEYEKIKTNIKLIIKQD